MVKVFALLFSAAYAHILIGELFGALNQPLHGQSVYVEEIPSIRSTSAYPDGNYTLEVPDNLTKVTLKVDSPVNHYKPMAVKLSEPVVKVPDWRLTDVTLCI